MSNCWSLAMIRGLRFCSASCCDSASEYTTMVVTERKRGADKALSRQRNVTLISPRATNAAIFFEKIFPAVGRDNSKRDHFPAVFVNSYTMSLTNRRKDSFHSNCQLTPPLFSPLLGPDPREARCLHEAPARPPSSRRCFQETWWLPPHRAHERRSRPRAGPEGAGGRTC